LAIEAAEHTGLAGMQSAFSTAACTVLRFGFTTRPLMMSPHTSKQAGGDQELGWWGVMHLPVYTQTCILAKNKKASFIAPRNIKKNVLRVLNRGNGAFII